MRVIFAGTPVTAVPSLQALLDSSHEVVAVVTRPPARSGRGRSVVPSPVAQLASAFDIPVIEASHMRDEDTRKAIEATGAELGVVVAYGALIPQDVLDCLKHGWVNLHFSDLPRWRGAAPVQRAIQAGESRTASCVFQLEAGLDTGPVFSRVECQIPADATTDSLLSTMALTGAQQIVALVDALERGTVEARPQDIGPDGEFISHAPMLRPAEGCVTFTAPAPVIDAHIRAFTSNPGAWTVLPDGKRLKLGPVTIGTDEELTRTGAPLIGEPGMLVCGKKDVLVACSEGWIRLGMVAPAGKGWMDAAAWARGARPVEGCRLGQTQQEESTS